MSNLRLVKNVSATNVTSVNVTDCFNADFDIYKLVVKNATSDGAFEEMSMRLINSSGSVDTGSNYQYAFRELRSSTTYGDGKSTSSSTIIRTMRTGAGATASGGNVVYFFRPFDSTSYTGVIYEVGAYSSGTPQFGGQKGMAWNTVQASITGFQYFVSSNQITNIDMDIYGVRFD